MAGRLDGTPFALKLIQVLQSYEPMALSPLALIVVAGPLALIIESSRIYLVRVTMSLLLVHCLFLPTALSQCVPHYYQRGS